MNLMESYAAQLEKNLKETMALLNTISEDRHFAQLKEGSSTPVWLLGHLSVAVSGVLFGFVLGQPRKLKPEETKPYLPAFFGGTPPTQNPADYDSWDTLLRRYKGLMQDAIEAVSALDGATLDNPISESAPPPFKENFPTVRDGINQIIAHDAYHRGQIALIVKYAD